MITALSVLVAEFNTGVAGLSSGSQLLLMPNPTDGLLRVQVSAMEQGGATIRLLAMDGLPLLQKQANGSRTVLDLRLLKAGAYLLEWTDAQGIRIMKSVVRY